MEREPTLAHSLAQDFVAHTEEQWEAEAWDRYLEVSEVIDNSANPGKEALHIRDDILDDISSDQLRRSRHSKIDHEEHWVKTGIYIQLNNKPV